MIQFSTRGVRAFAPIAALLALACGSNGTSQSKTSTQVAADHTPKATKTAVGAKTAPIHALVQLTEKPTTVQFRERASRFPTSTIDPATDATVAAVQQLSVVRSEQGLFADRVAAAKIANTREVYRLQRVYNGIVYSTDAAGLARLRSVAGARAVHVMRTMVPDNARGVPFIGVPQLWSLGVPLKGDNVRVGVIDSGIDYTHANFGGAGTPQAYLANDRDVVEPGSFPTAKVVGGTDFAGAAYDAADPATSVPVPDDDPMDFDGHGSHVSGTIAGFGVNTNGTTYAGPYDNTLDPTTLAIGPGAAPNALLYALKVFGEPAGSTSLAALAVEWATDPNGDGDFSDHLDVVNLSLGSSFGVSSDPEAVIYTNAVNAGVVVVASAGNANDIYFVTGAPASTPSVISVAATSVGFYTNAVQVNAPAALAGKLPAGSAAFGATTFQLTGDVVATVPANACLNAGAGSVTNGAAIAGKIALIARGTCGFSVKANAAEAAGAIAVIITNNAAGDPPGMAATAGFPVTVPTVSISQADGTAVRASLTAGDTVNATLDSAFTVQDLARADSIASFSSRGPSRSLNQAILKPDLSAPGVNVFSTAVGTGAKGEFLSGTSMASPLAAGMMALLKQAHPAWTPAELKALAMNTAVHDIASLPGGATKVSPVRQGAGRVDAAKAQASEVIAYDKAAPERVSLSFTTQDVAGTTSESRIIQLSNKGAAPVTYDVSFSVAVAPGGTAVTTGTPSVTVPAGGTVDFELSFSANAAAMVRARDASVAATSVGQPRNWLSEASGYVVFTPQGGGSTLRVPYFAAPFPASTLAAAGPLATSGPSGASSLALAGTGIDTTALAPLPNGVLSLSTAFELGYFSPRTLPSSTVLPAGYNAAEVDNANLRYVGVTSNAPDGVAAPELYFAINTWDRWGTHRDVEFDVFLREAGAPDWQYAIFNTDLGRTAASPGTDVPVTVLVNLATGQAVTEDFVNGVLANQIDIPLFLSDTMVLPVFADDILADRLTSSAIEYKVVSFSSAFGFSIDETPVLRYDLSAPAFATQADPVNIGPGVAPFWAGADGVQIPITYDLDRARATQVGGVLLVNHHNAVGSRAQVVQVSGLTCTVDSDCVDPANPVCDVATGACVGCVTNGDCSGPQAYCDSLETRTCQTLDCRNPAAPACPSHYTCSFDFGSCLPNLTLVSTASIPAGVECPGGGVRFDSGFDDNGNGALEQAEVISSNFVCNGVNGASATVVPELPGANCAGGGVKITTVGGTPTFVCNGVDGASVVTVPEPAGANCASGGVKATVGAGTPTYVCNGTNGAAGPPGAPGATGPRGAQGSSGCTTSGGASSLFPLLGLGLLAWRRRRAVTPAA